jgi:hypothetical protein
MYPRRGGAKDARKIKREVHLEIALFCEVCVCALAGSLVLNPRQFYEVNQ